MAYTQAEKRKRSMKEIIQKPVHCHAYLPVASFNGTPVAVVAGRIDFDLSGGRNDKVRLEMGGKQT